MFSGKLARFIAIGATVIAIGGSAYGIVAAADGSGSGAATTTASRAATARAVFGGGSNARSGPAAGGAAGTVVSVSASSHTLSTSAGQNVTVNKTPSTTYLQGRSATSPSAVGTGEGVLVLGTVNGTTIAASQVIVQTTAEAGSATAGASKVVPLQRGERSASKQVGQIPASYTQGSGTIVSGTTANQATQAALTAYPGGIVDRVVKLSDGEYEVHSIGVNWPHHVFVSDDFKVVGAN